jgi:hypothetical protein
MLTPHGLNSRAKSTVMLTTNINLQRTIASDSQDEKLTAIVALGFIIYDSLISPFALVGVRAIGTKFMSS